MAREHAVGATLAGDGALQAELEALAVVGVDAGVEQLAELGRERSRTGARAGAGTESYLVRRASHSQYPIPASACAVSRRRRRGGSPPATRSGSGASSCSRWNATRVASVSRSIGL